MHACIHAVSEIQIHPPHLDSASSRFCMSMQSFSLRLSFVLASISPAVLYTSIISHPSPLTSHLSSLTPIDLPKKKYQMIYIFRSLNLHPIPCHLTPIPSSTPSIYPLFSHSYFYSLSKQMRVILIPPTHPLTILSS